MRVGINRYRGNRLRLTWTWNGRQRFLALGVTDDDVGRLYAQAIANQIERDMIAGRFDETLNEYRRESDRPSEALLLTVWQDFTDWKARRLNERTLIKYRAIHAQLSEFFAESKTFGRLGEHDAGRFFRWLAERVEPRTMRDKVSLLAACWDWAIERGYTKENPWRPLIAEIGRSPTRMPQPFSGAEVARILAAMEERPTWRHYSEFMRFCFGVGCRTGEAIALDWQDLNWQGENCICTIATSYNGKIKTTKTGRVRQFRLPPSIAIMLRERRERIEGAIVFPSPGGERIAVRNFTKRAWVPLLESAGIPYRQPNTARSTFVTQALKNGMPPQAIAEITGHSVAVLFRHYAGYIGSASVPELW